MNNKHIIAAIMLAKTIILKNESMAIQINNELQTLYPDYIISENKTEWKYYLNLTGEYHELDIKLELNSIDTNEVIVLNKDNLANHPITKSELLKREFFYETLTNKYPDSVTIIEGMLNDITMDVLLEAKNGSIVAYSNELVESNEYSLISKLSDFMVDYLYRWEVQPFVGVENLYLPMLVAGVTSAMLFKILNLRLGNIHTFEVHSLFMEEFFKAHRGVESDIGDLNSDSKMWLYRNLRLLEKDTGLKKNLDKIIVNILTPNNILVDEVKIVSKGTTGEDYLMTGGVLELKRINSTKVERDFDIDPASLTTLESRLTNTTTNRLVTNSGELITRLESSTASEQQTKILVLTDNTLETGIDYDILEYTLDNILAIGINSTDTTVFNVNIVGSSFNLNLKTITYLLLGLLRIDKLDTATSVKLDTVLKIDAFNTKLFDYDKIVEISNLLEIDTISDIERIRLIARLRSAFIRKSREVEGVVERAVFNKVEKLSTATEVIEIENIKEVLISNSIEITGFSLDTRSELIVDLLELVANVKLSKTETSVKRLKSFTRLIEKLTSYSLQILPNIKDTTNLVDTNYLRPIEDIGSGTVLAGSFKCFEDFIGGLAMQLNYSPTLPGIIMIDNYIPINVSEIEYIKTKLVTKQPYNNIMDEDVYLIAKLGSGISKLKKPVIRAVKGPERAIKFISSGYLPNYKVYNVSEMTLRADGTGDIELIVSHVGMMHPIRPDIKTDVTPYVEIEDLRPVLKTEIENAENVDYAIHKTITNNTDGELVPNGWFENGEESWKTFRVEEDYVVALDTEVTYMGKPSVRLERRGINAYVLLESPIELTDTYSLDVSFYAKRTGSGGLYALDISVYYDDDSHDWFTKDLRLDDETDWTKLTSRIATGKKIISVTPYLLAYDVDGILWATGVSIKKPRIIDEWFENKGANWNPIIPTEDDIVEYLDSSVSGIGKDAVYLKNVSGGRLAMVYNTDIPVNKDARFFKISYFTKAIKEDGGNFTLDIRIAYADGTYEYIYDNLRAVSDVWTKMERELSVTKEVVSIKPYIIAYNVTGEMWATGIFMEDVPDRPFTNTGSDMQEVTVIRDGVEITLLKKNLIKNGSFEYGLEDWSILQNEDSSIELTDKRMNGSKALSITTTGSNSTILKNYAYTGRDSRLVELAYFFRALNINASNIQTITYNIAMRLLNNDIVQLTSKTIEIKQSTDWTKIVDDLEIEFPINGLDLELTLTNTVTEIGDEPSSPIVLDNIYMVDKTPTTSNLIANPWMFSDVESTVGFKTLSTGALIDSYSDELYMGNNTYMIEYIDSNDYVVYTEYIPINKDCKKLTFSYYGRCETEEIGGIYSLDVKIIYADGTYEYQIGGLRSVYNDEWKKYELVLDVEKEIVSVLPYVLAYYKPGKLWFTGVSIVEEV